MKVKGLAAIDQRTVAARHLLDWRRDLLDDLGGDPAISAAQRTLADVAIRTRLYLDHVDTFLMEQTTLVVRRKRNRHHLMPLVEQRLRLADSLARVLGQLGLERRQKPPIDLTQYLSLPLNRSSRSDDRLRPFVKRTEPLAPKDTPRGPSVPWGVSNTRRRKSEANRTDQPTGDFRETEGSYAAWRVYR